MTNLEYWLIGVVYGGLLGLGVWRHTSTLPSRIIGTAVIVVVGAVAWPVCAVMAAWESAK